jgi:TolB protein
MQFRNLKLSALALPALLVLSTAAAAQDRPAPDPDAATAVVIAVPPFATAKHVDTDAGNTWALANQISGLITADFKTTSNFIVADVKDIRIPSYPEVTAPSYPIWRAAGAKLLLQGFINARPDGRLTIGCYVYDVQAGREITRQGFALAPNEWRRAAHRCADDAYAKVTGNPPPFDSRIAYVAQTGTADMPVKRLAIMDYDGSNHSYLTAGDSTVLTPHWSPKAGKIAYASFSGGRLHVQVLDLGSNQDRTLLSGADENFAPAFSPDGQTIALSIANTGNTDIFTVGSNGGVPRRLTTSPAIDTSPSFSPDGKRIVFTSDRSGSPQIYVMNADGTGQRRVSFGGGVYGSPVWSPDGDHIAFTRIDGTISRVGVMDANGSGERIITLGPSDEQPAWSPDGRRIAFERLDTASQRPLLAMIPARGGDARPVFTPQGATDPFWAEREE